MPAPRDMTSNSLVRGRLAGAALGLVLLWATGCSGGRPDWRKSVSPAGRPPGSELAERATGSGPNIVCGAPPVPDGAVAGSVDASAVPSMLRIAVMGDYGTAGPNEQRVAALIKSWNPDYVFTTGDNNYPDGAANTIDANIGQYYHQFISPYRGRFGCSAETNRFFPALGNHDWYTAGAKPYRDYFQLPGNERYYDVVFGNVHLFVLDSDPSEPDGVTADSVQAAWLKSALSRSSATWRVVTMHHAPYSSGPHLSTSYMQWPYKEWGADIVFAGHDHDYEHLDVDGLPYVVSGLGGTSLYTVIEPLPQSLSYFDTDYGSVLMTTEPQALTVEFFTVDRVLIDRFVVRPKR